MRGYRKFAINTALSLFVILCAEWMRYIVRGADRPLTDRVLGLSAFLIFFALLSVWGVSIRRRVMRDNLRYLLLSSAYMMFFWLFVRSARYFFSYGDGSLSRLLWYLYYIPMLTLPLLGFFVALCIGKPEDRRPAAPWFALWGGAFGLSALVLTNDLHHFVFAPLASAASDALVGRSEELSYAYGWGYFLIAAWIIALELASVLLILYKGRENLSRRRILLPLAVFFAAVIYWLGYWRFPEANGVGFIELTVGISWFTVLIWESCITIGLIPVNTRYADFFHHATVHIQITDPDGRPLLSSADAEPIPSDLFAELKKKKTVSAGDDTELHLYPLNCGYAVWEEDVRNLAEMIAEQRLNAEELREGNTIARTEYLADRRRAQIREKTRLYNVISSALQGDFDRIRAMVDALDATEDPSLRRDMLARINLEGVFLKRAGNALMISEAGEKITGEETELCFAELKENMRLCGPELDYHVRLTSPLSVEETLSVYSLLREISGGLAGSARSLYVLLSDAAGALRLSVTASFDDAVYSAFPRGPLLRAAACLSPSFDDGERTLSFFRTFRKEAGDA